jgi:hypothetical protein
MFTDHISMFLCPSLSLMSVAKATRKPLTNVGFIWKTFRFRMPIRKWKKLAEVISDVLQIPAKARIDAFHIAMASVHGIQFLLTWNCKHIANPEHRPKIERACRDRGMEPPLICTPFDLLES